VTQEQRRVTQDSASREARLIAHLVGAGYPRAEPPILQPASVFLDLSGEDIRGRIFLTADPSGNEFCLRPEYTIPVCRLYLASAEAGRPAAFSYHGPVFRHRSGASPEFRQAGLESFGRTDREAADAEIFTLALEAATGGARRLDVRMGDTGLFNALLDALDLPSPWLRRIRRGHIRGQSLATILAEPTNGTTTDHSGVLAALEGVDKQGARALVQDLLSIAGISSVGGRSASEIAERFLEQSAMKTDKGIGDERRKVLERFFDISGDPDAASVKLRALARDAKLDLSAALDTFDARSGFIAARGADVSSIVFSASFGRNLDYYTGFVFEAHDATRPESRPLVGGGRYDRLLRTLGAAQDIPAVGAAIWCDRLLDAGETA
jgi:ATP phosphoribosyltransferase regulatory subunit